MGRVRNQALGRYLKGAAPFGSWGIRSWNACWLYCGS